MKRNKTKGFTLIELLVVLVIIGLLAGVVAPQFLSKADSARIDAVFAQFEQIKTALDVYRLDNYNYPTTEQGLEALVSKPTIDPQPRQWSPEGYIKKLPKDPWGRDYVYVSPGENGAFDIISLGADGVQGGDGFNADIGNWMEKADVLPK